MLALLACNDEKYEINSQNNEVRGTGELLVNLNITRSDDAETKATVKTSFANNDVVYIVFKGITAPKYLEMKYSSSGGTWTATAKNGLSASNLSEAADKKMTAIYLPYGSDATIVADEGLFIFEDGAGNPLEYKGYFLQDELVDYTIDGNTLSGSISLSAPSIPGGDKLIHFDVSGFTVGNKYDLYQEYVKPLLLGSISASGVISTSVLSAGAAITGYQEGSVMSFSGILDASAVNKSMDYAFLINDWTNFTLYTREVNNKTLSANKYIGIGNITDDLKWNTSTRGIVDLGLSVKWAPYNIGSIVPEGYGYYYAWGETETKSTYSWPSYNHCNGSDESLTKYCSNSSYGYNGYTDAKVILDSNDDVAHTEWGENWRMPTRDEFTEILNNCTWAWTTLNGVNGYLVTSNETGYTNRSIFLPAAGCYRDDSLVSEGTAGRYWSSSLYQDNPRGARSLMFDSEGHNTYGTNRYGGFSVRPVWP